MAVRIDVEGGLGGSGGGPGPGGDGGRGGAGGHGGPGGPPGSYQTTESYSYTDANGNTQYGTRTVTHWGSPGAPGRNGHRGSDGPSGDYGDSGSNGITGNVGSVQFLWKDPLGKVIEAGVIGYNLRLVNMEIVDSMGDGIFEPLEELIVTNVTLLNDGDMTVPGGSVFAMLSSNNITAIEPNGAPIPSLAPGNSMILTQVFRMKLADVPLPTEPGPLKTTYTFNTNATLLKRQFLKAGVTFGVDIAWPINIQSIASPTQMARKETRPFIINISNPSLIPYAASPETEARIVLRFEPGLIPNDPRAIGAIGKPWVLEIPLAQIDPGATATVSVDVTCWEGSEFFDRTPWKAELLLRGRLIEFSTQKVRTCPDWYENFADVPQDVIMFTADHFSLADYLAWKSICHSLKLGLWMWDSERYRGISADATTGEPHGQGSWRTVAPGAAIIFPSNPNGPQGMNFADIIAHFRKFPMSTGEIGPGNYVDDAGFLFFGGDPAGIDKQMAANGEPIDIADWNLKFEGKHLPIFKPDDKDIMEKAVSLTKKIGEKDPGFPYRLMAIEKEVEKESFLKYSYGTLIIRRVPFKKYSKFVYAPRAISSAIGATDLNATVLPLHSHYGQCMALLISVLPIHKKLHSLATENHPISFSVLEGKNALTLWPTDLLKVLLYRDLRADLEHEEKDYPHALALSQAILASPSSLQNINVRLAAFYALERLAGKKSIFSSNKPINNIKDAIKTELFKLFKEDEYKQMKKSNEAAIKDHKKLRMPQFFHESVSWLFEKQKK
jgi:hypothetical protein